MSDLEVIRSEIKDMRPHLEQKDIKRQIIKDAMPAVADIKNENKIRAAKHAQPFSQTEIAKKKREISMDMQSYNDWTKDFDFIEEACGSGEPTFEFYDTPQEVSEGVKEGPSYPIIGRATGVFAPIGVMSRNNRIYEDDHYPYLLENQALLDKITHRGMLGTIGHHNKKVDDEDLANGRVSHVVTDLHVKEEPDGSRNLYGTLEILDTPAGHLLKTYYDSGLPLFVSSRGGGRLIQNPHETFKRVDKTKYYLETFDIVKNPGFLQAKPVYEKVSESAEETDEKVIVTTKDHMENVEAQCNEESEDKLDKLTAVMTKFIEAITEAKAENENEQQSTKKEENPAEAKAKKIAEEPPIDKPEKLKDKPEDHVATDDEERDDEESAVADSVTEEVKPLGKLGQRKSDKLEKQLADDEAKGQTNLISQLMNKDERIANLINPQQEQANKNKAYKAKLTREYKARHANDPKPKEVEVKQITLFDKNEAKEELKKGYKKEEEVKEPYALSDLAWVDAKERLKKGYKESK